MLAYVALLCVLSIGLVDASCLNSYNFTGTKVLNADANYKLSYLVQNSSMLVIRLEMDAPNGKGFMGFGIPEQTTGSMEGADIVTVRVTNGKVLAEDRNVNFDPFPVGESIFPRVDTCQNWEVLDSEISPTHWSATLRRSLISTDPQDRNISANTSTRFLFAWRTDISVVAYHEGNRGVFALNPSSPSIPGVDPPADSVQEINLVMPGAALANDSDTYYICKGFDLANLTDLSASDRHAVLLAPYVEPGNEHYVHHLLLHACGTELDLPLTIHGPDDPPSICLNYGTGISPLNFKACTSMFFGWAVGGNPIVLPDDVGFRIGEQAEEGKYTTRYLILEIHYNNPNLDSGVVDHSGVKMWVTNDDTTRSQDAASLTLGMVSLPSIPILPAGQVSHRESTCSKSCTERFTGSVNVFGSFLHMHNYGKQIWTTRYPNADMTDGIVENRADFWNFAFQQITPVNYQIYPGDQLNTHGVFDLSEADHDVKFGEMSSEEMLFDFLWVYPATNLSNIFMCGWVQNQYTICGKQFIHEQNPISDGSDSLPIEFGKSTSTCSARAANNRTVCSPTPTKAPSPGTTTPSPTKVVTSSPTIVVTKQPTIAVTPNPTMTVTGQPTTVITSNPTVVVTEQPTIEVTGLPTSAVTSSPTIGGVSVSPTSSSSSTPTMVVPTTRTPTLKPTKPTMKPSTLHPSTPFPTAKVSSSPTSPSCSCTFYDGSTSPGQDSYCVFTFSTARFCFPAEAVCSPRFGEPTTLCLSSTESPHKSR